MTPRDAAEAAPTPVVPTTPLDWPCALPIPHEGHCIPARSTPAEALDRPDWLEEAENGPPWKSEGRIEGDDADGVWLANEQGDSLWLTSHDVAWLLNNALSVSPHNREAAS